MAKWKGTLEDLGLIRKGKAMAIKKKTILVVMAAIVCFSVLLSVAVALDRGRIRTTTDAIPEKDAVISTIDSVELTETIKIQGWAVILGEEMESVNCNVMLIGEKSKEQFILPTMIIERNDLTEAFSDGIDYSKAGFLANIKKDRLSLEEEDYDIYLEYLTNGHHYLVSTDKKVRAVREIPWQETDTEKAGISFLVDSVTVKKNRLTVTGWLFCREDLEEQGKTKVLLLNSRTGQTYELPTDSIERMDLLESFSELPENVGKSAGFTASIEKWRFDFGYDRFEVCLQYMGDSGFFMIHTEQYVNLNEQEE